MFAIILQLYINSKGNKLFFNNYLIYLFSDHKLNIFIKDFNFTNRTNSVIK